VSEHIDKVGLILSESLSDSEFEIFLALLRYFRKTQVFDIISHILQSNENFLLFLDALAVDNIRVPSRKDTLKILDAVSIYSHYIKQPYASHKARVSATAERFKSSFKSINRTIYIVASVLANDPLLAEGDVSDDCGCLKQE